MFDVGFENVEGVGVGVDVAHGVAVEYGVVAHRYHTSPTEDEPEPEDA